VVVVVVVVRHPRHVLGSIEKSQAGKPDRIRPRSRRPIANS
jgi:hypothetical protein